MPKSTPVNGKSIQGAEAGPSLCVELARVTGNRPMQYRMVRPIVIAAGLDDAAADAAIAYAVEKGWLTRRGSWKSSRFDE
jgi:hypothetical protein